MEQICANCRNSHDAQAKACASCHSLIMSATSFRFLANRFKIGVLIALFFNFFGALYELVFGFSFLPENFYPPIHYGPISLLINIDIVLISLLAVGSFLTLEYCIRNRGKKMYIMYR